MYRASARGNIQKYGGDSGHVYGMEIHSRLPFRTSAFRDTSDVHDTAQSGGPVVSYSVLGAAAFIAFFFELTGSALKNSKDAVEELKRQGLKS